MTDATADIWVLTEGTAGTGDEIQPYGGLEKIDPAKLGALLTKFTGSMNEVLAKVEARLSDWSLDEVTFTASLNAELGLVLVGKAGVEGGIELTYRRKTR
jgi:hypothetical protein